MFSIHSTLKVDIR